MKDYIKADRKQVFGSEELDDIYLKKIKLIFDEKVKDMTLRDKSITMPLANWS